MRLALSRSRSWTIRSSTALGVPSAAEAISNTGRPAQVRLGWTELAFAASATLSAIEKVPVWRKSKL